MDGPASQRRRQGSGRAFHFCQSVRKGEDIFCLVVVFVVGVRLHGGI